MIHYTKAYIQALLDKYMDGTTTLEEEDILAGYFRGKDVPQEWEDYRQMFQEIEAMKPQPKIHRRWIGWSVAAAAVVAGVLYLAIPSQQAGLPQTTPLVAQADTTKTQQSEEPVIQSPDTTSLRKVEVQPVQSKKRRMRKTEPTIHDYGKAYALMAQAEQERMEVERQIEQAEQEIIEAQLAAYGFIPVMQEDGTIIYINEQTEFIAYEE
ncbi:MAG: hypothetical protein J5658_01510 [Prevotella sp.]|nr:hypothetical protein [Prevotella sp.]